jgi:hypothetical protein
MLVSRCGDCRYMNSSSKAGAADDRSNGVTLPPCLLKLVLISSGANARNLWMISHASLGVCLELAIGAFRGPIDEISQYKILSTTSIQVDDGTPVD